MDNKIKSEGTIRPVIVRLIFILCFTAMILAIGTSLATRDWKADNLLKTVMIGAIFLMFGIFLIVGAFYYRFAEGKIRSMGWRQAFVYLYIFGIVVMSLVGLVSLVGAFMEGRWSEGLKPVFFLGIAAYNAFVLLPPMWREMKRQAIADGTIAELESNSLPPGDS